MPVTFVDSNVLIYAYDRHAGSKHRVAVQILSGLWTGDNGALSPQVLQEFYVNIVRKISAPLSKPDAHAIIRLYEHWCTQTTFEQIRDALRIERETQISYWDALIVASASQCHATRILSEDLNHGQVISGIEIVNPFLNP